MNNSAVGTPLFLGLLLPFAAAYLQDRKTNWWALIPGGIMLFLALVTLLADNTNGEWVGSLFLFLIGVTFLAVYLTNRKHWWALIPAYVFFVVGFAPLASLGGRSADWFGPLVPLALGIPFIFVYFRWPEHWWAIIPGGVLAISGLAAGLGEWGILNNDTQGALLGALVVAGIAASFGMVWARIHQLWAAIVAGILAFASLATLLSGRVSGIILPVVVILAGGVLLYTALRPRKA